MSDHTSHSHAPLYLHGLEGGPDGTKGRHLTERFGRVGPQMPASSDPNRQLTDRPACFEACYELARAHLRDHPAPVLVGSSFGGGVTMALLQRGDWRGPVVLLAPACVRYQFELTLPEGCHMIVIHAPDDDIIPYSDAEALVKANPTRAELWVSDGGHQLHSITHNGMLERAVRAQLERASSAL